MNRPLFGLLALAFILRAAGAHYGLPYLYHNDEPTLVNHAMAIGARGWNTHYFVIAPFVMYFLFVLFALSFLAGKLLGIFPDTQALARAFFSDPSYFYALGRLAVGVVFGTATVALLYKLGKRFFSKRVAFLSAFFLAIAHLHVQHSHYIYADIPLTFALLWLLYRLLLILEDSVSMKNCVAAGAVLGFAMGVKYTAAYALLGCMACFILAFQKKSFGLEAWTKMGTSILAAAVSFALVAPYTFLAWMEFYGQMKAQTSQQEFVGWTHHILYSFANGLGWPLLLAASIGAVVLNLSARKKAIVLLSFFLGFYILNAPLSQRFARYAMPLVPVLCLWAAVGWHWVWEKTGMPRAAERTLLAGWIVSMLAPTLYSDFLFFQKDTRTQASEWIERNIPAGSAILLEGRQSAPRLRQTPEQIGEKRALLPKDARSQALARALDLTAQASARKTAYRVYTLTDREEDFLNSLPQQPTIEPFWGQVEKARIEYFVSGGGLKREEFERFKRENASSLQPVVAFTPYRNIAKERSSDAHDSTAAPHTIDELFSRERLGPPLEIFKVERHDG